MHVKRNTLAWGTAIVGAVALIIFSLQLLSLCPWVQKPHMIVVHSYNILRADNKDIFYFRSIGSDSVFTGISFVSDSIKFGMEMANKNKDLRAIVEHNKIETTRKMAALDSIVDEMKYYLDVHDVQEEGYDMVAKHLKKVERDIETTGKILQALNSIGADATLEIKHVAITMNEDSVEIPSVFMEDHGGIWYKGIWLRAAKVGAGVAHDSEGRLLRGEWHGDTLSFGKRTDKSGTYRGQFDRNMRATGHGNFTYADGSFYEGHWLNDVRDGFGFAVNTGSIKAGEWKNDKYRGERMSYTSERIYGIDISRYQHGKGKKYYPIYWNKLRITHLGNTANKHANGEIDYPVSFVYIKSTEGISIRNKYYAADYRQARKNGIHCGAYHFFSTKSDAEAQAKYFIKHTFFKKGDFPPVLDVEPTHSQIENMGGKETLFKAIRTWMKIVKQHTGVRPILYVNQTFVNRYLSNAPDIKRDYDIWIARYGEYRPDVRLIYWQLTPYGKVNGIHGDVDINVFNGYQVRFNMFLETERIK